MTDTLIQEARRAKALGRRARIFNLGCGPAQEIQNFLKISELSDFVDFTLVDFNDETLKFAQEKLNAIRVEFRRQTGLRFIKKSVNEILKECNKSENSFLEAFDFVYCAGLFDYLSDRVCKRLVNIFYSFLVPGGLLVVTNVDASNPIRGIMEYVVEWFLVYRDKEQLLNLVPENTLPAQHCVKADQSGANIFLEVRSV